MSPFARDILDGARSAHDPTEIDRVRVAAKLASRIGNNPPGGGGGAVAGLGLVKVGLPLAVAVVALGFLARRSFVGGSSPSARTPPAAIAAPPVVDPQAPVAPPAPLQAESPPQARVEPASETAELQPHTIDAALPTAPSPPAARASRSAAVGPTVTPTDLAGEMALIAAAQTAIQSGDYETAIAKLDEHQRSYPSGVLGEERTAARVVALCGAGRQAEARSVATAFLAKHPSSPLAPRVRASCATQ